MAKTYTEITTQFDALQKTRALLDSKCADVFAFAKKTSFSRLLFLGCGSSYSISKSMALIAQMHLGQNALALPGGDALVGAESYRAVFEGALVVAVSRSGSTSEIIRACEKMRALGCAFSLLSIVCVENSPLSQMSDFVLEMPWAFDESVCQTRTVNCLYFAGAYLAAKLSRDEQALSDFAYVLDNGPAYLEKIEPLCKQIAELPWTTGVVLGDAQIAGLCEEAALAFKEICQLNSNHYHLLDSRHGPMVMIGQQSLVLIALGEDSALSRDLVCDVAKKGAVVLVFADQKVDLPETVLQISYGRPLCQLARGVAFLPIAQLICYFKSFHTGANPDAPTGLDAWIKL